MTVLGEFMALFHVIFLILAAVAFLGATLDVKFYRITLLPLGLLFWVMAEIIVGK